MSSDALAAGREAEQRAQEHKTSVAGVFGRAAATCEQVGPSFFGQWAD